jgi:hypothetical protein
MTSEKKIMSSVWILTRLYLNGCYVGCSFFNIYKYSSILQEAMAYDMIIGTTKIVNGNTLTQTYMENLG